MKLAPYLNFEGNCETAVNYYKDVFGGNIVRKNYYSTAPFPVPESHKDKIIHCQLDFDGNTLFASDAFPGQKIYQGNGITLSLGFDSYETAATIFDKLADGGKVIMPFEKQYWGASLGMVEDKFGKSWMISTDE